MKIKVSKKAAIRSIVVKRATVITTSICGVIGLGVLAVNLTSATTTKLQPFNLERNPEYEQYLQDVRNGNADKWSLVPSEFVPAVVTEMEGYGGGTGHAADSRYSLLDNDNRKTIVKNQGGDGICWAMGISTVLESNLKTKGINVEFAPKQLDYLMNSSVYNSYLTSNLGVQTHNLGDGSNIIIASHLFTNSNTPVSESDFMATMKRNDSTTLNDSRYNRLSDYWNIAQINQLLFEGPKVDNPYAKEMNYSDVISNSGEYAVSTIQYRYGTLDLDEIKQSIVEKGAVYVGTYGPGTTNCWDANTKTIIDRGSTYCSGGHVMSIVGWDDNHSYYNPATNTSETGAFILQNSWGKASLFWDYYPTVDQAVAEFDTTGYTEAQIANLRSQLEQYFNRYDPNETVYLAYNTATHLNNDGQVAGYSAGINYAIFDGIDAMATGEYIVGPLEEATGHGSTAGATDGTGLTNEFLYTYSTTEESKIERISVLNSLGYATSLPAKFNIYVDAGNGYKGVGNIIYPAGVAGKKELVLNTPVTVNGTYRLKVLVTDPNDDNTGIGYPADYANRIVTSIRLTTGDVTPVTPDDPDDPTPDDPDDPDDPTPSEPTGKVDWVQDKTHRKKDGKDVILKIDYPMSLFQSIKIDGETVDADNYRIEEGSTIIILKGSYIDTLEEGDHVIMAYFDGKSAVRAEFTVASETAPTDDDDIPVPATSDDEDDVKVPNTGTLNESEHFASVGGISAGATVLFIVVTTAYLAKNKDRFSKKVGFDKK